MYTILVNSDNTLTKSKPENIMQGSSMIDRLHFLVDVEYKGLDMRNFTAVLEYVSPISKKHNAEPLTPSSELYKEKIEYVIPFNTALTKEVGDVEIKLIFTYLEMNENGQAVEYVRPTGTTIVKISPVDQWGSYISDSNLDNIAQMMLTIQAQNEQLKAYAEVLTTAKADSIKLDTESNELYLTSNGEQIGDAVSLEALSDEIVESAEKGLVQVII